MVVTLVHEETRLTKQVKVGFSWTTLFFGCLPALFRGDLKWTIVQFLLNICTFGLFSLVFAFFYNKIYVRELIEKGYRAVDSESEIILKANGIII